jgi:thermostable 8-oxoguanine DNA glycosylase
LGQERIKDFEKSMGQLLDGMITRQDSPEAFQQLLLKKITGAGYKEASTTSTV